MIELEEMEFYAYHGCFKEEQIVGNKFFVNISYIYDYEKAAEKDNLLEAVNYLKVYEIVKQQMEVKSKLIEHVALRIVAHLKQEFAQITRLTVKISKMNPPLGGQVGKVSFTLSA